MSSLRQILSRFKAIFSQQSGTESFGPLDPVAWILVRQVLLKTLSQLIGACSLQDMFDADLNQVLTQVRQFVASLQGIDYAKVSSSTQQFVTFRVYHTPLLRTFCSTNHRFGVCKTM